MRTAIIRFTTWLPVYVALAATLWFASTNVMDTINPRWDVGTTEDINNIRPANPNGAEAVLARHADDCWTGEQMPKVEGVPPRVLISAPGKGPHIAGSRMVGKALEQIFEDVDHGLTVYAFCR